MSHSELPIIFSDESLVAINKPAGWLVHRTSIANARDIENQPIVLQTLRNQLGYRVYPVHRLDRATSGVLLFARSSELASSMSAQFEAHQVEKTYWALTRGWVRASGCEMTSLVERMREQGNLMTDEVHAGGANIHDGSELTDFTSISSYVLKVANEEWQLIDYPLNTPEAHLTRKQKAKRKLSNAEQSKAGSESRKPATTLYRPRYYLEIDHPVGRYPQSRYTLLEMQPETGRPHQLRRHLHHIAHPIVGDVKYGRGEHNRFFRDILGIEGLLLFARSLCFSHPVSAEKLKIQAEPSGPIEQLFKRFFTRVVASGEHAINIHQ